MKDGVIDWIGGLDEAIAHIEEFQLVKKAQPGANGLSVYRQLKAEMWRETVKYIESCGDEEVELSDGARQREHQKAEREARVKNWEMSRSKL